MRLHGASVYIYVCVVMQIGNYHYPHPGHGNWFSTQRILQHFLPKECHWMHPDPIQPGHGLVRVRSTNASVKAIPFHTKKFEPERWSHRTPKTQKSEQPHLVTTCHYCHIRLGIFGARTPILDLYKWILQPFQKMLSGPTFFFFPRNIMWSDPEDPVVPKIRPQNFVPKMFFAVRVTSSFIFATLIY